MGVMAGGPLAQAAFPSIDFINSWSAPFAPSLFINKEKTSTAINGIVLSLISEMNGEGKRNGS